MAINYNQDLLTDEAIMAELGEKIRQVRLRMNITQGKLAEEAGIAKRTLERFEKGQSVQLTNLIRILRTIGYINELLALIPDQVNSPMAMLLKEDNTRYRATGSRKKTETNHKPWEWGE